MHHVRYIGMFAASALLWVAATGNATDTDCLRRSYFSSLGSLQSERVDLCLLTAPLLSATGCSRGAAPNSYARSKPPRPSPGPDGCQALRLAPQKLTRSPRRPFKTMGSR